VYRLFDRTSGLCQPFVVGRPAAPFGRGLAKLVEGDLIEILDDDLQPIGEIVV
jgi:hypothetical protein